MSPRPRHRVFFLLIAVCSAGLDGCAQPSHRPSGEVSPPTAAREKLALDLKDRGELAEALIQWKILSVIDPASEHFANQAEATRQLIDKKTRILILDGLANWRQGSREAARLSFLKALALNPRNTEAFDYLRQLTMQLPGAGENNAPKADGACCRPRSANESRGGATP